MEVYFLGYLRSRGLGSCTLLSRLTQVYINSNKCLLVVDIKLDRLFLVKLATTAGHSCVHTKFKHQFHGDASDQFYAWTIMATSLLDKK